MTSDAPAPARRRLGVGAAIVLVLVALTATIVIGIVRSAGAPVESVGPVGGASPGAGASASVGSVGVTPAVTPAVYVHVAGAVRAPGLYVVDAGARVMDVVAAAGGFADDAARDAVNLARPVGDGEQLVVPRVGEDVPPADAGSAGAGSAGAESGTVAGKVDLNTATAAELDTLPRIGPAMAARIIAWREENGRFTSVEDLLAVPGIGEKMLESLRDGVTV